MSNCCVLVNNLSVFTVIISFILLGSCEVHVIPNLNVKKQDDPNLQT